MRNCAKLIFDDLEMTTIQAYDRKQNKNDAHIDNIYVSSKLIEQHHVYNVLLFEKSKDPQDHQDFFRPLALGVDGQQYRFRQEYVAAFSSNSSSFVYHPLQI